MAPSLTAHADRRPFKTRVKRTRILVGADSDVYQAFYNLCVVAASHGLQLATFDMGIKDPSAFRIPA
jgi:hypothetical protein